MKKITITLIFALFGLLVQAQPFGTIANGEAGSSVRSTLNSALSYLDGLGLDFEFSADASSWHYGWQSGDLYIRYSDDFGTTWSSAIYLWDGAGFENLAVDTLVLNGDSITSFVGAGWDSLYVTDDNYLQWWDNGAALDSVLLTGQKYVYRVTLPVNGTLSGSATAATDLPAGWSLSTSGGDLQINHGLGRYSSAVNVAYNTSGSSYRQLRNFDNAYSGVLNVDNNNLTIESISNFYTAYALRITIIFE